MDENQNPPVSSSNVENIDEETGNVEVHVNSPLGSEQEVNKPLVQCENVDNETADESTDVFQDENKTENAESDETVTKKDKRKVYFPGDGNIVKSYLDPPDPWKNVPNWRTDDLLKAYKSSCDKHGTKPLNKILQQLQCIENVGERYEILSLKGERLDLRQCESLEDIFKHVRFRCVDLEATHLDDEMAVAIFEMVEYYESACKLNISFNKGISARGWQSCSRLVRKTPCLTFIDARNCDLNDRVIPIFGRALRMGCFLQRLHLQNANLAGRALVILVAALKLNEILKELFIGDNKFVPTDGVQIGNLLKYNHKLELLDLRNNHLQDVGVSHICDGLAEQCLDSGLLTLVLWNNQITFQGMTAINKSLATAVHLETLNLGHNPITNEGIHILKDGLLKAKGLLKLGLSGSKVSCEGAVALAEVIADNTKLVRVDLQENDIKTAGLMALALALKVNENITRLDVDRETKKESGIKDYVEQQKKLQKDISNVLERNRDALHKRETAARELEERNNEHVRQLQEAAIDIARSLEESTEYIPSVDTIHRPKLLFLPQQMCPEHELDSPVIGEEEFVFEPTPQGQSVQLANGAGTDLLSPQYCPNPKATAKRIFSVTKVTSPTLSLPLSDSSNSYAFPNFNSAQNCVVNSPTQVHPPLGRVSDAASTPLLPQICTPLPSFDLHSLGDPVPLSVTIDSTQSPNSLQKVMEEQTLVSYIQQIVEEKTSENTDILEDGTDDANVEAKNGKMDDSKKCILKTEEITVVLDESVVNKDNHTEEIPLVNIEQKIEEELKVTNGNCDTGIMSVMETEEIDDITAFTETVTDSIPETHVNQHCETDNGELESDPDNGRIEKAGDSVQNNVQDKTENLCAKGADLNVGNGDVPSSVVGDDSAIYNGDENNASANCDSGRETVTELVNSSELSNDNTESVIDDVTDAENSNNSCETVDTISSSMNENSSQESDLSSPNCDLQQVMESNSNNLQQSTNSEKHEDNNGEQLDEYVECENTEVVNIKQSSSDTDLESYQSSVDSEPWNPVNLDPAETTEPQVLGPTVKPDFHTNLSLNGLRQELASLIDEEPAVANGTVCHNNKGCHKEDTGGEAPEWMETSPALGDILS